MKGIFYYIGIILFLTVSCKELEPKCCVKCEKENEQKYYSIDWLFNRCGECCLDHLNFGNLKYLNQDLLKLMLMLEYVHHLDMVIMKKLKLMVFSV